MEYMTLSLAGIACFLLAVLLFFVYSGLLTSIEFKVTKPPLGTAMTLLYKYYVGPYQDCGPAFEAAAKFIANNKDRRAVGIYYDNPEQVPKGKSRYVVGLILPIDKEVHHDTVQKMQDAGYLIHTLPDVERAVVTRFPWKNMLSILIGVYRVYPALNKFLKKNNLKPKPCLELYQEHQIYFIAILDNGEDFYVPECQKN